MMTAPCPYLDRNCRTQSRRAGLANCPDCARLLKSCARCRTDNRAFANFCRDCGTPLPPRSGNWTGYKAGPQRLGAIAAPSSGAFDVVPTFVDIRFDTACRALLGYDGHLIAVSVSGAAAIVDPRRPDEIRHFQLAGPITSEPAIAGGTLYVGARGAVTAYSLGAMTLTAPHLQALWTVATSGTPVQAITPAGDTLFVTIADGARRQVCAIETRAKTRVLRTLHDGEHVSWLAAEPARPRAIFFSHDGPLRLHVSEGTTLASHDVALPHPPLDHPIAVAGDSAFGIFGEQRRLCRIDINRGTAEEGFDDDTQAFAIDGGAAEWIGDTVRIETTRIVFSRGGARDSLGEHDRIVRGSPVLLRGRAAAVGLLDGRILVYDLSRPPMHHVWRLPSDATAAPTALAAFDDYIAAGNERGGVGVAMLRAAGETQ